MRMTQRTGALFALGAIVATALVVATAGTADAVEYCNASTTGHAFGPDRNTASQRATRNWERRIASMCRGRQHAGRWDCAQPRRLSCAGRRYKWSCTFTGRTVPLC
jgi:hypothetical protein